MSKLAPLVVAVAALAAALPAALLPTVAAPAARAQQEVAAVTLKVGDKAPPLAQGKYVQGEPVERFEPGTVYVIEFWATWCGPCVAAIPHVTELQKKHEGKVVVVGQNVWEEDESKVEPFVKDMGAKMAYRVALDTAAGQAGQMAQTWMAAAGQTGIPCSMIVDKTGTLAWVGHPMAMDKPLEQIVAGTYNLDLARAVAAKAAANGAVEKKIMQALSTRLGPPMQAKDYDKALAVLNEVEAEHPDGKSTLTRMRLGILMQAGPAKRPEAYKALRAFAELEENAANAQLQNELAWEMATNEEMRMPDLDLAFECATRAVKLTERKDAASLDTLARVHHERGEQAEAVKIGEEALAAAEGDKSEFEAALKTYRDEPKAK